MEAWKERTELLVGAEGLARLLESSVAVIGLGGVGAYAAEMLCRAGVGHLILLDSDVVSESNKNRQLIALDSTIGKGSWMRVSIKSMLRRSLEICSFR